ncbi:MAG: HEAT repeat domain-containing protein [Planctomycetes bacterium]|nr:HEAT repeat domain-containing protein [Planctomycetota bacterium]
MLEGLLGDPDLYVRCAAVFALSQIKARSSAAKIATLLQDPALEVRSTAAQALDGLDAREQAGELIRTLRNPDSNGHGGCPYAYAQTAFRRWKPLEVLPQILDLLKESSAYVRSITLTTLDQMEAPIPEAVLVSLLDDPDPMIRQRACARLGEAGAKTAVPAIRALLDDPEDRLCAAGVLYDLGDARGTAELEKRLSDPDPSARAEAATTLGRTQALAGLLGSLDVWRQGPLMRTLADRNIREAIPEIVAQLAGPCRQAAAEALGRLHADAHAADLARLLQDADFSVRYEAAGALLKLDAGRASAALLAAIDREGGLLISQSREDLMTRLRPVDALIRRARDPDPILRERAIELLGKIGGPEARKAVAAALADPDPVVRRGAVEALSALDDVDPLAALLKDPNSIVRVAAAGALCLHGRKEAARVLLDEAERRTGVDLTPLNALRRPKEWAVLVGTKAGSPLSGRKPELFQSLAKLSGLKIDVLRDSHSGDAWVPAEESVAEAMERLLTRTPYALVVEEGRLRLLPRADSLAFWKAWAEGR